MRMKNIENVDNYLAGAQTAQRSERLALLAWRAYPRLTRPSMSVLSSVEVTRGGGITQPLSIAAYQTASGHARGARAPLTVAKSVPTRRELVAHKIGDRLDERDVGWRHLEGAVSQL